jgi:hypothetical protein
MPASDTALPASTTSPDRMRPGSGPPTLMWRWPAFAGRGDLPAGDAEAAGRRQLRLDRVALRDVRGPQRVGQRIDDAALAHTAPEHLRCVERGDGVHPSQPLMRAASASRLMP